MTDHGLQGEAPERDERTLGAYPAWAEPSFTWPDGNRSAVALSFDLDAETMWLVRDPTNRTRLGVMSQAQYEFAAAIPLILRFLRENGLPATFFVPGWVAEQHPDDITAIVTAGHEIANHGWEHQPIHIAEDREEALIVRAHETLLRVSGNCPVGYRAPYLEVTAQTEDILRRLGYEYSSNMMDAYWPYVRNGGTQPLVEIPLTWMTDDAPFYLFSLYPPNHRQIFPPDQVLSNFVSEFDGLHAVGGVATFCLHPQLSGRPSRLLALQRLVDHMRRHDVWFAEHRQIAKWTSRGTAGSVRG